MEISLYRPFDDKDIKKIFVQIEKLKLMINQKEDDLKNEINEKDSEIKKMNEKILEQENKIKNNEIEIAKLNDIIKDLKEKNEKDLKEKDDNIKVINDKLLNQEEDIETIKQLNKKMKYINNRLLREEEKENRKRYKKYKLNKEIYKRNEERKLPEQMYSLFSSRFGYLREELRHLNELERDDGFLTSIGTNLLISKNYFELEGIIEAPKNSSYKNGIFNFVIKFNHDYPRSKPQIFMKTKIFHTEVCDYDGRCCIKFINEWNEKTNLFLILIGIYEFFFCNNDHGYAGIATDIYRSKNYNLFEEKCQEYIKLYSFNMDEEKIEYFIQDCYDNIDEDSIYYFINAQTMGKYEFEVECVEDIIKILIERFENFIDKVLIADNKIYFSLTEIKEIEELPENHKIIIAPKLIQAK